MDRILTGIAEYLWSQSWQIALLVAIVAVANRALHNHSAHLRYLLWLVVVAKCLVPPIFGVAVPILPQGKQATVLMPQEQLPTAQTDIFGVGDSQSIVAEAPVTSPADSRSARFSMPELSARAVLAIVWLAGLWGFAAVASVKAVCTMRRLAKQRTAFPQPLQSDIDELFGSLGVQRGPRVWLVEHASQPFVWGLWRGDIYLPSGFASLSDGEHRRDILAHELSHVLRFDAAVNLAQIIAQAVFWFHPLVWWANAKVRQEREKCCDETAIARLGVRPRSYSRAIVEALLAECRSNEIMPSLAIAGRAKNIEERIRTMLRPGRRFHERPSATAVALALLLALLLVPTTLALTHRPAKTADSQTQETEPEAAGDRIEDRRVASAENLKQLGLSLTMYAMEHERKYPDELMAVMPYLGEERAEQLANFMSDAVEYLGAGKTRPDTNAHDMPVAYDLALLRTAEGTNVLFADAHVEFLSGQRLARYKIELPQSSLGVLDVRFEPIHQGKNVVHVKVANTSDAEQILATHIYTRSPDYGSRGMGWGTPFFETIEPNGIQSVRFVFKIPGPVTENTYVRLRFYNPETQEQYEYKWYFDRRRYGSADLAKARADEVKREPASQAEVRAVTQAFEEIRGHIRNRQYEQAWERFSSDFRRAEYQITGFEAFRRAMEPTQALHSAFTWERLDFLALRPGKVSKTEGTQVLSATLDGQTWTIDFVREDDSWKIDWVGGYTPGVLRLEGREAPKPAARAESNLRVLDIQFDPVQLGKNALRIEVQNEAREDQTFGIDIRVESALRNWQKQFLRTIKSGTTEWMSFDFEVLGPLTDAGSIRLRFYNPPSADAFDMQTWFDQRRYTSAELELHEGLRGPTGPVSEAETEAVTGLFKAFQGHVRGQEHEAAWELFSQHMQSMFGNDIEKFKGQAASEEVQEALLNLSLEPVTRTGPLLTLNAAYETQTWKIHFSQDDGQWKIYQFQVDQANWKERLLPTLEKRVTDHFDIYYSKGSTAEKEIDRIAQQKEQGYRQICAFLGADSDIRICMVFFEDGRTKQRQTGHQGAGWAYGNTIVEIYNEQERLDPYHETTHILMGPVGSPPALFNEGFAVYMSERLGAPALENLSGGQATVHQRAKELNDKGEWIELRELLGYTEIGSGRSRPPVAYPEAASFVKFLIDSYGKDKFLQTYRTLRNSGAQAVREENIRKLEEIYGTSLEVLQQQWEAALARS